MKYPNKAIVNEKGLFFAYMPENEPNIKLPPNHKTLDITEENFKQISEIKSRRGYPVLIDGTFVDKKEELKDYLVAPTRQKFEQEAFLETEVENINISENEKKEKLEAKRLHK
jgi:hypothetical protein